MNALQIALIFLVLCFLSFANSAQSKHTDHKKEHPKCGVPGDHELPRWSVGIFHDAVGHVICTATLIAPRVALTSGICGRTIEESSKHEIYLINGFAPKSEKRSITKTVVHKDFDKEELWKEGISALIFDKPFTADVEILCLPKEKLNFVNKHCTITAWGVHNLSEEEKGGLRREEGQVLPPHTVYPPELTEPEKEDMKKYDGLLCVGGKHYKGLCKGDDGSTLACKDPSGHGYVMAGLLAAGSHRDSCTEPDPQERPDYFTDIGYQLEWLRSVIPKDLLKNSAPSFSSSSITILLFVHVCALSVW